jgi:transcriptional regulator with XRE-family HTH domain
MPDKPTWRDQLKNIIGEPGELDRLANAIGVRPITLTRWTTGESNPRLRNIRQLLQALPLC